MSNPDITLIAFAIAVLMFIAITFSVGYAAGLEHVNKECIKTGHLYVIDNVFKCELIKT